MTYSYMEMYLDIPFTCRELPLPPSPHRPCIILTLLPASRLYSTVPVSQPASLAAPLLPAAAVFTFNLLLLDHCCLRGCGGYSSRSSKHVCEFSTFCSIYSEILLLAPAPNFFLFGCSMLTLLVLNTLTLAEVTGHSAGRGGAAVVLYPDWFSPLSIMKMDRWAIAW